jgi:hypothetical protein
LADSLASRVLVEIEQIDRLLMAYTDLLDRVQQRIPDLIEITAVASVLHSFYNGLEHIFSSIAKGFDRQVPTGSQWHRDLLVQMTHETSNRGRIISTELAQKLTDYLGFRHFYRHSYSFFLDWAELRELVTSVRDVWAQVRQELREFVNSLGNHQSERS